MTMTMIGQLNSPPEIMADKNSRQFFKEIQDGLRADLSLPKLKTKGIDRNKPVCILDRLVAN